MKILWDFLSPGLFPGGAPFNVAYHLHRLGAASHVVPAVECDVLGDKLLRRLDQWGIPTEGVACHSTLPTGFARATIGPHGDATHQIASNVVWDEIAPDERTFHAATTTDAILFGSLAQCSADNRAVLERILAVARPDTLRVFDVNLRPPHDDVKFVRDLARRASVLKLNAHEAARLAGDQAEREHEETSARTLAATIGCQVICVTAGAEGGGPVPRRPLALGTVTTGRHRRPGWSRRFVPRRLVRRPE